MYRGTILKSRDGIPRPTTPPPGIDLAHEAQTARSRFYPVTIAYTTYALVVLALGLRADPATAMLFAVAGAVCWTLLEYLVHRYVLHGPFPDGSGWLRHRLHLLFDSSHGDHHQRPWDGRHINGGFATVPFAAALALAGFLAPLATLPVFVATILLCYVIEEWIHYAVHFHRIPWRYFCYIRKHHLYHHSGRGGDVAFGLSSGIWDVPLRTRIPSNERRLLYRRSQRGPRPVDRGSVSPSTPSTLKLSLVLALLATSGSLCVEAQERSRALSFGTGWKDLGSPLEFRSQLELGYRFRGGHRVLLAISHLSNGLGHGNPGEESLSLAWEVPLGRPPAH